MQLIGLSNLCRSNLQYMYYIHTPVKLLPHSGLFSKGIDF